MGGAKQGYPTITRVLGAVPPGVHPSQAEFEAKLHASLRASVHKVNRLTPKIVEVVVKAPLETGPGQARERAALRVLGGVPGAVPLLAEAADPPVLVLADLGDGPSLADMLLGTDPAAAEAALGDWASARLRRPPLDPGARLR